MKYVADILFSLALMSGGVAILLLRNDVNLLGWILIIIGFLNIPTPPADYP